MPPELLEHFKKTKASSDNDNTKRKEAVQKARMRMEDKSRKARDEQKTESAS